MTYSADLIGHDGVAGIVEEWRSLNAASSVGNIFLGPDWYLSWADSLGAGRARSIVTVRDAGRLVAVVPFVLDRVGVLGARRLSMASALDAAPDFLDFLTADRDVDGAIAAIVDVLQREYSSAAYIDLPSLPTDSRVLTLAPALMRLGGTTFDDVGECPAMQLAPQFDALLRARFDKKKRFNLQRQVRLAMEAGGLEFVRAQDSESVRRYMTSLFELHGLRKAATRVRSSFLTAGMRQFHVSLAQRLLQQEQLGLFVLKANDRPVSAVYGFYSGNSFLYYQSGFDPAWSRFSVGTVALTLTIQECCAAGLTMFHFLRGDESYKSTWATHRLRYGRLRVYGRSLTGEIHRHAHRGRAALARWIRTHKRGGSRSVRSAAAQ